MCRTAAVLVGALLVVIGSIGALGAAVVQIDVEDRSADDVASGFEEMDINSGGSGAATKTFTSGVTVDVDSVGAGFDDRARSTPTGFPLEAVYRDFIFAPGSSTQTDRGLDVAVSDLAPNKWYTATVWSFDSSSGGNRVSDWSVNDALGSRVVQENYTFNGSVLPTEDDDNQMQFAVGTTDSGDFSIHARGDAATSGTSPSVFFNGLQLDELPMAEVLAVDFNNGTSSSPANTQDGFSEFLVTNTLSTAQSFGTIDVTVTAISTGGTLGTRLRSQPTNSGAFDQEDLLRDFVFANNVSGVDEEMEILIEGLTPNRELEITLWSYDDGSGGARTSDWYANGLLVKDDYVFNGDDVPTDNDDNAFTFLAMSDALGKLLLRGQAQAGTQPAVFLNGLRVAEAVPEPSTWVLLLGLAGMGLVGCLRRRRRR